MEKCTKQELYLINGGGWFNKLITHPEFYNLLHKLLRYGLDYAMSMVKRKIMNRYG